MAIKNHKNFIGESLQVLLSLEGGGGGQRYLFLARETDVVKSVFKKIKIIIWLLSPSLWPQYRKQEAHERTRGEGGWFSRL